MFLRPAEIIDFLKEKSYIYQGLSGADFGCGSGYFSIMLANIVGINGVIYAIDIDEESLNSARELADNFRLKNIKFLKQDLEKTSGLNSDSLDFVFSSQILYQSDKPELIIKEAYRILKRDGIFIILEPHPSNPLFSNQKVHYLENLQEICEKNGFKIIDTKDWKNYYILIFKK